MKERTKREPTLIFAVVMLAIVLVWAILASVVLTIPTVVMLMTALVLVATVSVLYLGMSFDEIMASMVESVKGSMEGIFFFFLIGGIIAVWMLSGCLPTLIYYGLEVLSADNFLPSVFFLTSLVSFATGSSWTTMATVGVIGVSIGSVLGVPLAPCAGACVAGALAGDKICPISEGTNMAAASVGSNLYTHIRTALPTHALAWIIAIVMYLIVGLGFETTGAQMEQATDLQMQIAHTFNVSPVFILPIIIVLGASAMQWPTIPTVAAGIIITIPFAMAQGHNIVDILCAISDGVVLDINDPMLAEIVNRGGISSMFGTMSIAP